jgi:hypothetical protein
MPCPDKVANWSARAVALGLLALTVTACGGRGVGGGNGEAAERPGRIWTDAREATARAADVHVRGTVTRSGQALGLDLDMSRTGAGGGTIDVQGSRLELVVTAHDIYVDADVAAWALVGGGPHMARYAGRWVVAPRSDPALAALASFASTPEFVGDLVPQGRLSKRPGLVAWHGQEAVLLSDSTRAQIYVAAAGAPYLLYLAGGTARERGAITFSAYGRTRAPAAPARALALPA